MLVVTPYYNKPTQEGLYQHFKAINDAVGIPIIIYNIPSRSVIDMSVETMKRLYELKNIVGVKDATGDVGRVSRQRHAMGPDFIQLSGEDMTALAYMAAGGHGCISVTANVAPAACAELMESALKRDYAHALQYAGPADAAAWRDLPRARRMRGEIRPQRARARAQRNAAAAGPGRRRRRGRHPPRDGARRDSQRVIAQWPLKTTPR